MFILLYEKFFSDNNLVFTDIYLKFAQKGPLEKKMALILEMDHENGTALWEVSPPP